MFTGLIETTGELRRQSVRGGMRRLVIASSLPLAEMRDGESIAVDGVCLTVTSRRADRFGADVIPETVSRTTLGRLHPGSVVNLERALRVGDRLGGHLVQGHVDAVAPVVEVVNRGGDYRLRVGLPDSIARYVAEKGSIALNGVSLTVAGLRSRDLEVALIPETLSGTNLGRVRAGDLLNVEVDLMARYLERLVPGPAGG